MLTLDPSELSAPGRTLLCLGAHCDDIEIGCAGIVFRLLEACPGIEVHWVVLCANDERRREAEHGARLVLGDHPRQRVRIESFRDGFLPYAGAAPKELFESLKREIRPDLILTHFRADLHQDHRVVNELTWNTFRDHLVLEYEIPKYDGDLGAPNVFVPLSAAQAQRKVDTVLAAFPSQHERRWFTAETFRSLLRLRGIECNAPEGYAEAFYGRKLVLEPRRRP